MRRFHACRKALAFALHYTQPRSLRRFLTPLKHPLHADADAQERNATADGLANGISQTRSPEGRRRGKMTHAGKHDLCSFCNLPRIGSDSALLSQPVRSEE